MIYRMLALLTVAAISAFTGAIHGQVPEACSNSSPDLANSVINALKIKFLVAPDIRLVVCDRAPVAGLAAITVQSVTPGYAFEKNLVVTQGDHMILEPIARADVNSEQVQSQQAKEIAERLLLDNPPHLGSAKASVTVVMYTDYQCEFVGMRNVYCENG